MVSSGQAKSVAVGSGGFNRATLKAIPFNAFSPVEFPVGAQLKIKLPVRMLVLNRY